MTRLPTTLRLALTVALFRSFVIPAGAQACGLFDSSCKNPTSSVRGQVFVVVLIVLIVDGVVAWRTGKPRWPIKVMVWTQNRRVRQSGTPDSTLMPTGRFRSDRVACAGSPDRDPVGRSVFASAARGGSLQPVRNGEGLSAASET